MRPALIGSALFAACLLGPAVAWADDAAGTGFDSSEYYHGFVGTEVTADNEGFLYLLGSGADGEIAGYGGVAPLGAVGGPAVTSPALYDGVEIGVLWQPELVDGQTGSPRVNIRNLAGNEPDRVGVRADVTAILFDESDPSRTTAWRVTGSFGSTSFSLAPEEAVTPEDGIETQSGIMWQVGVGWSSGSVSLNADYLSSYKDTGENGLESDMAVLSFGAGYAIIPGLSLYGELSLVDESAEFDVGRLDTVVIIGTGLNF